MTETVIKIIIALLVISWIWDAVAPLVAATQGVLQ